MRAALISIVLIVQLACSQQASPHQPIGSEPSKDDAAILGVAIDGLNKWDARWSERTFFVMANTAVSPAFPCSKSRSENDRTSEERLRRHEMDAKDYKPCFPWDLPKLNQDLDVENGPVIPAALLASIVERSREALILPQPISSERLVITNAKVIDRMFRNSDNGWLQFRKKFRGAHGLLEFSAPGYNSSRSTSILYVSLTSGPLNGVGVFFVLSKISDKWVVTWSESLWVS